MLNFVNKLFGSASKRQIKSYSKTIESETFLKLEIFFRSLLFDTFNALIILIFGGLTIYFDNEVFFKMKPTIINLLFALILYGGVIVKKPLLKFLLGAAIKLEDEGWKILTQRWISFFIALAILNEIVWRTQSTDIWVNFKVFGILPITFIFTMTQFPLIKKYQIED